MYIPMPMWLVRKIVRRNPWLMADNGSVKRRISIPLLLVTWNFTRTITLGEKERARLLKEPEFSGGGDVVHF